MATSTPTCPSEDVEDKLYQEHMMKCKQKFIIQSAANSAHPWRLQLFASNAGDTTQNRRFPFQVRQAWRFNIIVYIATEGRHDRAVLALAGEFHKADPTLLLQNRYPFLRCTGSERSQCPPRDLDEQGLKSFIRNHLALCDLVQSEALVCPRTDNGLEDVDQRILPPTQRAITMVFWPAAVDDETSLGHAAIVRTGDHSSMRSGPISLESLREHEIPGFLSNDYIIHLPLERAIEFLVQLDHRETAANAFLRDRSHRSAEIVRVRLEEEAREGVSLSQQGLEIDAVEWLEGQKQGAEKRYTGYRKCGFSELQAKLASQVAIHQLGVEGEQAAFKQSISES